MNKFQKFKLDPSVCNWEFLYQNLSPKKKHEFNLDLFFTEKECTKEEAYRHFRASEPANGKHRLLSVRPHTGSWKWDGDNRRWRESFDFEILPDDPIISE